MSRKYRIRKNPKTGRFQIITRDRNILGQERATIEGAMNRLFYLWAKLWREDGIDTWTPLDG